MMRAASGIWGNRAAGCVAANLETALLMAVHEGLFMARGKALPDLQAQRIMQPPMDRAPDLGDRPIQWDSPGKRNY
jgi:hypothetical protein